jgi:hypothetical protein
MARLSLTLRQATPERLGSCLYHCLSSALGDSPFQDRHQVRSLGCTTHQLSRTSAGPEGESSATEASPGLPTRPGPDNLGVSNLQGQVR